MRKRTPFNIALILLMSMLIGLVFMAMFHACTPQITMPLALPCPDVPAPAPDTVLRISTRTTIDTLTLPGSTITVMDSFPCPPSLKDTTIYVTRTRTLPAQVLYVPRTIHDTVQVVTQAQGAQQTAINMVFCPLLGIVLAAIANLVRAYINRKKGKQ